MMIIATCFVKLQLNDIHSLKEKRRIVKSLLARLPREFNLAVAEVDYHEVWQTAGLGLVTIGSDAGQLHALLERALDWIEKNRPDTMIADYDIEIG